MTFLSRRDLLIRGSLFCSASALALSMPEAAPVDLKTVTYASPGGKDLAMDLYLPERSGKKLPIIVFLHGGGWFGGTRKTGPDFKRFCAMCAGRVRTHNVNSYGPANLCRKSDVAAGGRSFAQ
jgi:acetyl esterase/lipase